MALTIENIRGRVGDLDSHESIPVPRYGQVFGPIGKRLADENDEFWAVSNAVAKFKGEPEHEWLTSDREDNLEITEEVVWTVRGTAAPGSVDMGRRAAVMDTMGIQRQLIFPMMGIVAWIQAHGGNQAVFPPASAEQQEIGKQAIDAYNDWAGKLTRQNKDRMWVVGMIASGLPGMTPELMTQKAQDLIDKGCRAILISSGLPPGGVAPGDTRLDPFYALLAKNNTTLTFHPPSGMGYRASEIWESKVLNPMYAIVTVQHIAEENFIAAMILSGVFDRHPTLRVAVVEAGASWIGPLADRMDDLMGMKPDHSNLSMLPSKFLSRNVRSSIIGDEPVDLYIKQWPHLQDVYCYSSDYPHIEGGQWSLKKSFARVAPLGDEIVEKFFVTNSRLVLPDAA